MLEKESKETKTAPKAALDQLSNLEEDELLTSEEVAQMLKCTTQTVRILAKTGKLPHFNINTKRKLFSKRGVHEFLKKQHKEASAALQQATHDHMPWIKNKK